MELRYEAAFARCSTASIPAALAWVVAGDDGSGEEGDDSEEVVDGSGGTGYPPMEVMRPRKTLPPYALAHSREVADS